MLRELYHRLPKPLHNKLRRWKNKYILFLYGSRVQGVEMPEEEPLKAKKCRDDMIKYFEEKNRENNP